MDRCRYPSKPCLNPRAVKLNGELHRFCEQHRRQANQNQMRWSKRKQTVLRSRRGDASGAGGAGGAPGGPGSVDGDSQDEAPRGDEPPKNNGGVLHGTGPGAQAMTMNMAMGLNALAVNVNAAGASLSHLSLSGHHHGMAIPAQHQHQHQLQHAHHTHPHHAQPHSASVPPQSHNPPMMTGYQDHMQRQGMTMLRGMPPAPGPGPAPVRVPPIQTPLPPLLPPRDTAAPRQPPPSHASAPSSAASTIMDQPDPTAVHALLMLERAASVVSSSNTSAPREYDYSRDGDRGEREREREPEPNDDADDAHVRRDLKRAKSNEWLPRPTLSPAGLPTVASLASTSSSSTNGSSGNGTTGVAPTIATAGRSASWQPPPVREEASRESLVQWLQRKQASLPSLTNLTRIEKRPYDSISSSGPSESTASTSYTGGSSSAFPPHPAHHHRSPQLRHHAPPPAKSKPSDDPVEASRDSSGNAGRAGKSFALV